VTWKHHEAHARWQRIKITATELLQFIATIEPPMSPTQNLTMKCSISESKAKLAFEVVDKYVSKRGREPRKKCNECPKEWDRVQNSPRSFIKLYTLICRHDSRSQKRNRTCGSTFSKQDFPDLGHNAQMVWWSTYVTPQLHLGENISLTVCLEFYDPYSDHAKRWTINTSLVWYLCPKLC